MAHSCELKENTPSGDAVSAPQAAVTELGAGLDALQGRQLKEVATCAELVPREQAQALMALSLAGNSLIRAQSQLQGRDPDALEQLKNEQVGLARQGSGAGGTSRAAGVPDLHTLVQHMGKRPWSLGPLHAACMHAYCRGRSRVSAPRTCLPLADMVRAVACLVPCPSPPQPCLWPPPPPPPPANHAPGAAGSIRGAGAESGGRL